MTSGIDKITEAYHEKLERLETWSGFQVKDIYTPRDMDGIDYDKDIADAGQYPFTRGIHPNMFRGRLWTRRGITGYGSPTDTNKRLKFQIEEGATGLWLIPDLPTHLYIDGDHPRAEGEVGRVGIPLYSLIDMEDAMNEIDIDKITMTFGGQSPVALCEYFAYAEKQGVPLQKVRGTLQNDPIHGYVAYGFLREFPLDLAIKLCIDVTEYCAKKAPLWNSMCIGFYNWREMGINAAQELAFGLSSVSFYIEEALKRGLNIDEFAPKISAYPSVHIDFFEELAKIRALRRMWAKMLKDKFGAKDARSLKFRFGVRTSGCSLVRQQPLNNIIRIAYEALAGVLAGCQSLELCCYDEPIALPTEEAIRICFRTQQIIAYETGAANVSDPLGGSYYIENLTNKLEEEANKIINEIEEMGGALKAAKTGWFDREVERAALKNQKQINAGERTIVGVNAFTIPPEEDTPIKVYRIPTEGEKEVVDKLKTLKETRDGGKVKETLVRLHREAERGDKVNLIPPILDAVKAYATTGEIMGTIRQAYGYSYDPFEGR